MVGAKGCNQVVCCTDQCQSLGCSLEHLCLVGLAREQAVHRDGPRLADAVAAGLGLQQQGGGRRQRSNESVSTMRESGNKEVDDRGSDLDLVLRVPVAATRVTYSRAEAAGAHVSASHPSSRDWSLSAPVVEDDRVGRHQVDALTTGLGRQQLGRATQSTRAPSVRKVTEVLQSLLADAP